MNKIEHLLVCLVEECAEVQKLASKSLRFGIEDFNPSTGEINYDKISEELNDLYGVVELLSKNGVFFPRDNERMQAKQAKVIEWMEYAEEKGKLTYS